MATEDNAMLYRDAADEPNKNHNVPKTAFATKKDAPTTR